MDILLLVTMLILFIWTLLPQPETRSLSETPESHRERSDETRR
jgi:hypothetical protein